jgi:RHS repeat-associated protein
LYYQYDAWGNEIGGYDNSGKDLRNKNPYRYRGYRFDEETGLYYLNSRYYNPEIGRFINADGLMGETGDILGHNMYAYAKNNPVMRVDPSGYDSQAIFSWGMKIAALFAVGDGPLPFGDTIGLIIAGGTIVIGGGYLVYENWDVITDNIKEIATATETAYSKRFKSGYNVYQISDEDGDVFYVGITRNKKARENAHKNRFGKNIKIDYVAENISLSQARVIETGLISYHTLEKLENKSLSISNLKYSTELLLNKTESDLLLLLGQ